MFAKCVLGIVFCVQFICASEIVHEAQEVMDRRPLTTFLIEAAGNARLRSTEKLLKEDASADEHNPGVFKKKNDVNERAFNGMTALIRACMNLVHNHLVNDDSRLSVVELLIANGADINISLDYGLFKDFKALHFAVQRTDLRIACLLLANGANLDDAVWIESEDRYCTALDLCQTAENRRILIDAHLDYIMCCSLK